MFCSFFKDKSNDKVFVLITIFGNAVTLALINLLSCIKHLINNDAHSHPGNTKSAINDGLRKEMAPTALLKCLSMNRNLN